MLNSNKNLVELKNVSKIFDIGRGKKLHAVDDITINIREGEILGLVGESGCGKSTLGRTIIKLYTETSGVITFDGQDITGPIKGNHRKNYAQKMQMIFQDPYSSLNPRMTVEDIIAEGPDACNLWPDKDRKNNVAKWLERVGLHASHAGRYPHEFSGGQRQRIGIARALAMNPKLLICDEPISALDVSVQAQIISLLKELQVEQNLTYLFIAHDLSMVRVICDRMAVMYLGKIIELGSSGDVYERPKHPYTKALIAANPIPDPEIEKKRTKTLIHGEIGSPVNPKPGCRFAARCPHVFDRCRSETPQLRGDNQQFACHLDV
ncbi:MAG: ABC transporter ATP-binding protein [Proteobacteria bacterium]|nr:ABC transporter ATP-binding protein [Pseudomonadota bacterium]